MINKIRSIIQENTRHHQKNQKMIQELHWANVYHDSIRGKEWIENLSLNIGRWAGNYSFFYVLNRVLSDCRPQSILELGLGESTKFITAYLKDYLKTSKHIVVEHNEAWKNIYIKNNPLSENTKIEVLPIVKNNVNGFTTLGYEQIENKISNKFDLYVIDGPFGSERYSRYDVVNFAKNFSLDDQFIIIMDDYNRNGEKDTVKDLLAIFKNKNIEVANSVYEGEKSVFVIATSNYSFLSSL